MATRNTQQETVKANVLPELDFDGLRALHRLVRMADDVERAYANCRTLKLFDGDLKAFMQFTRNCDPTHSGKYLRWILNRLNGQTAANLFDLDFASEGREAKKALLAFNVKCQYLPLDQRDILAYQSIREINQVLAEHADEFNTISYDLLNALDADEVMNQTLLHEYEDIMVFSPRSIEEAALLLSNDKWLDSRKYGFYRKLKGLGEIFIVLSGFGSQIAVVPHVLGERGVIFDSTGEASLFEDALMSSQPAFDDAPEIMTLMCKVDPALPFDIGLEEVQPFLVALNQFPLILHEDRFLEEDIRDLLLEHPELTETAKSAILEIEG